MTENHGSSWTREDDERLIEMLAKGWTYSRIGQIMGRNYNSIRARARKVTANNGEPLPEFEPKPEKVDPWPDLGPNAFKNVKVSADPAVQMIKPQDRTIAGVGTAMLVA